MAGLSSSHLAMFGSSGLPLVSVSQLSEQQLEAFSPDWPSLYWVLERFLEMFLSEEAEVRKQDE